MKLKALFAADLSRLPDGFCTFGGQAGSTTTTNARKEEIVHLMSYLNLLRAGHLGYAVDEIMSGTHEFEVGAGPTGKHPMEFHVTWGVRNLLDWVNLRGKDLPLQELEGLITVGGLCENVPCHGTLRLMYFTERKIRYTIFFMADGRRYCYTGEKVNIRPWNLPVSHTTCFGILVEVDGRRLVSRSVTHFRMKTVPEFLKSARLVPHP